jgi:hypothetical protein
MVLFIPPLVMILWLWPMQTFYSFAVAAGVTFLVGKSRRVSDPVARVPANTLLSPLDFHRWAATVTGSESYSRAYYRHSLNPEVGVDEKMPSLVAQVKAYFYWYANGVVFVIVVLVNGWCVFLWRSGQPFPSAVGVGISVGVLWGYGLGLFALRRVCQSSTRASSRFRSI